MMRKRLLVGVVLMCVSVGANMLITACASRAPGTLSPAGVRVWQANEAVVAIGTVQHVAISLNDIDRCDPTCTPLLSDANTRVVVTASAAAFNTIRAVPDGWRATSLAALTQIANGLDAAGKTKLAAYVQAARAIIEGL